MNDKFSSDRNDKNDRNGKKLRTCVRAGEMGAVSQAAAGYISGNCKGYSDTCSAEYGSNTANGAYGG